MKAQVLDVRYEVQQQLGKNAGRRTLLAGDLKTNELVYEEFPSPESPGFSNARSHLE